MRQIKKKIAVTLLSTSIIGTSFSPAMVEPIPVEAAFSTFTGKVTVTKLNVRATSSTKGKITGSLKKNSVVTVTGSKKEWHKISYKLSGKMKTGWVSSKYIKKVSKTSSSNSAIPGAPKANKEYKLKSGSSVYALDLSKANQVKLTSSFAASTKEKEMIALAKAIGAKYDRGAVNLTKISPDSLIPSYDDAFFSSKFYSSGKLLEIGYQSGGSLLETEAEYVIMHLLKPYFPNHYKKLAEKYIKDGYYQAAENDKKYVKYGDFSVRINAGAILIKKTN